MKLKKLLISIIFLQIIILSINAYATEDEFQLNLPSSLQVTRGESETIYAVLENTGNNSETFFINATTDCSNFTVFNSIRIKSRARERIPINIHIPLWKKTEQCILKVKASSSSAGKERIAVVNIKENNLLERLNGMKKFFHSLRNTVEKYGKTGIDITRILGDMDRVGIEIQRADEAVRDDNKNALFDAIVFLEFSLYYKIPAETGSLGSVVLIYKILWAALFVMVFIMVLIVYKMRS